MKMMMREEAKTQAKTSSSKRRSMNTMKSLSSFLLLINLLLIVNLSQVLGSGIFEINFVSLTDSLGRDLREDCCAWQNSTPSLPASLMSASERASLKPISSMSQQQQHHNQLQHQNQQCDPTKCQLIIRICVKNYQTQIDPNQCTFGELSAQVMKPHEAQHFYPSLKLQQSSKPAPRQANSGALPVNIHHQRMLFQQQALPLQAQQHPAGGNQNPFGYQTSFLASGQPRAMRSIAFHQPISFPFNFTWPVSLCDG